MKFMIYYHQKGEVSILINRKEEIKKKGFNMRTTDTIVEDAFLEPHNVVDFSKIKVGLKTLDDAIVDLSNYKKLNPRLGDKAEILRKEALNKQ